MLQVQGGFIAMLQASAVGARQIHTARTHRASSSHVEQWLQFTAALLMFMGTTHEEMCKIFLEKNGG